MAVVIELSFAIKNRFTAEMELPQLVVQSKAFV